MYWLLMTELRCQEAGYKSAGLRPKGATNHVTSFEFWLNCCSHGYQEPKSKFPMQRSLHPRVGFLSPKWIYQLYRRNYACKFCRHDNGGLTLYHMYILPALKCFQYFLLETHIPLLLALQSNTADHNSALPDSN